MRGSLFLELGGVIVALAVLARIAGRFGFSPIPLYLLSGLAVGEGGLLPVVTAQGFIEVGGEIGVILLLLMLGLEYSADELVGNLVAATPAGLVDLVLNFLPGLAAGLLFGWGVLPAVFLGGVTYISSSGVTAKLLGDLGWLGNRETPIVLSILVLEDLVMALYLPLLAALLVAGGLLAGATSVVLALVGVAGVLVLALRHGETLSRAVFSRSDEALLLTILGTTLLVAGLAERLQVSAAVGAFLVGIGLSGQSADRARTLLTPLRDLFAAVFFFFFGLRVDPASIPQVAGAALALGLATAATKLLTGWWAARRRGVGPRGAVRAGATLVARGEFSLIIAGLGVAAGVHSELGPLAAGYVILMAVAGPILARVADPLVLAWQRRAQAVA
ncbi:MAG: cation:proton antiporter [Actinomycetota bacterium]|nr:cation:proton antiporter [Actinomycetota bacterium]